MDTETLTKKEKVGCCGTNKCTCFFGVLVLACIGGVVAITFAVHSLREIHREPQIELKWWQKTIVYQIYPRSFQDSDGDGIGDLQGITSRLSYFGELGVGCIWLSPFFTSPMRDFGYDVSNYTEVDPMFGNITDFDNLIKEAHKQDIKVIIDFVPNHSSNESRWFDLSRQKNETYKDYYIWSDGKTLADGTRAPPNNWESVFEGPAWEYDSTRDQFYYHAFLASQPDLNFRNKKVREEMRNVLRFWCDRGVDGFRIDAVPHLFEKANQSIDEPPGANNGFDPSIHPYTKNQPEIFDVVKEWRHVLNEYQNKDGKARLLVSETAGISHADRHRYYRAGSVPFYFKLIHAKDLCGGTPQCLLSLIREGLNLTDGQWPNFVIGNHDNSRISTRVGAQYVDAYNMLLLTLPGTPTTYYGEELGMTDANYRALGLPPKDPYAITSGKAELSRDPERSPMQWNTTSHAGFTTGTPWLPLNSDFGQYSVQTELSNPSSSLNIYKNLAKIRQRRAFQSLAIGLPSTVKDVLVYSRGDSREKYIVALNLGTRRVTVDIRDSGYIRGSISMSTKPRPPARDISLNDVSLEVGEGLIIQVEG